MQFVNLMVGHILSWPVFGMVAVVILRHHLVSLIRRISSYEGMGQKITFGEELAKAEREAEGLSSAQANDASSEPEDDSADTESDRYFVLAEQAPAGAVVYAWMRVEKAVAKLGEIHGLPDSSNRKSFPTTVQIARHLAEKQIIPLTVLNVMNRLRRLRNEVAHGAHDPTAGEATAYTATAHEVAEVLETLALLSGRQEGAGDSN